jgi:hypothetical protein
VPDYKVTGIWRGPREPVEFQIRTEADAEMGSTFKSTIKDANDSNVVWLVFDKEGDRLFCVPWRLGITTSPLAAEMLE